MNIYQPYMYKNLMKGYDTIQYIIVYILFFERIYWKYLIDLKQKLEKPIQSKIID